MGKDTTLTKKQIHPAFLILAGVICGAALCAVGQWALSMWSPAQVAPSYQFTNPNLEAQPFKESLSPASRNALQDKLTNLINDGQKAGTLATAGLYFRDLNNGPVFGINQDTEFAPASLLKVPLAIAYYRQFEDTDPGILDQQIQFKGPKGVSVVHYPPPQSIEAGKTYSVRDLITLMLQDSDNDATTILGQYLPTDKINEVYKDLGVEEVTDYNLYTTTVRDYAAFFRILYNATYLDQPSSEGLLSTLSRGTFAVGLVAGVPQGTQVADKFGEKEIDAKAPLYQLNDCGIIYAPQHPYILCVMAQGNSYDNLASFIQTVSADVYGAVTAAAN